MTFEEKKSFYTKRFVSELTDPAKALAVINEILSDETLDAQQLAEIMREVHRAGGNKEAN